MRPTLLLLALGLSTLFACDSQGAPDAAGLDADVAGDVGTDGTGDVTGDVVPAAACDASWAEPTAQTVQTDRVETQLRFLQEEVGRFLDGTTPVFIGTFSASDTRGGWDAEHGDGQVSSRSAVAWLGPVTWPSAGLQLVVVDLETGRSLALRQLDSEPGPTHGSLVHDCTGSYSFPSSCTGCVPDFDLDAQSLELASLTLPGKWFSGGQPADLTVELQLKRVAPEDVSVAHLMAFGGGACARPGYAADYRVEDGQLVSTVSDWWSDSVDSPGCSEGCDHADAPSPDGTSALGGCQQELQWTGEVFIDLGDPQQRGLRDLELEPASVCCSYADPCGGAALFSRCFPAR